MARGEDEDDGNELAKDVYAYFGAAYFHSECVYRGVSQVCALLPFTRATGTRPRVEERLRVVEAMTLGPLIKEAKGLLPAALHERLDDALRRRNFLAHGFWYERIHLMSSHDGCRNLVADLDADAEFFRSLDADICSVITNHLHGLGMTDEVFEAMYNERRGRPPEPLPARPLPKRCEQIDAAWLAPYPGLPVGEAGEPHRLLVVRSEDGELWQLGDNGLSWCYLDGPTEAWRPFEPLVSFLPARIETRPPGALPFNYRLSFSTGVEILVVRRSEHEPFRWNVQKSGG